MTRFGMEAADFQELAALIRDVILKNAFVKPLVEKMRQRFLKLRFCFSEQEFEDQMEDLHKLL
jgi:hypothetical protein